MHNRAFSLLAVVPAAIGTAPAHAMPNMQALVDKSGCFPCHSMHTKIVGLVFADVAAKYEGDADTSARLAQKVREGGEGVWGRVPTPAHSNLKGGEAKQLVAQVLSSDSQASMLLVEEREEGRYYLALSFLRDYVPWLREPAQTDVRPRHDRHPTGACVPHLPESVRRSHSTLQCHLLQRVAICRLSTYRVRACRIARRQMRLTATAIGIFLV